jgi:hypothetical protein
MSLLLEQDPNATFSASLLRDVDDVNKTYLTELRETKPDDEPCDTGDQRDMKLRSFSAAIRAQSMLVIAILARIS